MYTYHIPSFNSHQLMASLLLPLSSPPPLDSLEANEISQHFLCKYFNSILKRSLKKRTAEVLRGDPLHPCEHGAVSRAERAGHLCAQCALPAAALGTAGRCRPGAAHRTRSAVGS